MRPSDQQSLNGGARILSNGLFMGRPLRAKGDRHKGRSLGIFARHPTRPGHCDYGTSLAAAHRCELGQASAAPGCRTDRLEGVWGFWTPTTRHVYFGVFGLGQRPICRFRRSALPSGQ
jgi:hypothetical protein